MLSATRSAVSRPEKSIVSSGPIAWLNAFTQARFTSSAEATPSSTIRADSSASATISREVMKPGVSFWQTIVCLP